MFRNLLKFMKLKLLSKLNLYYLKLYVKFVLLIMISKIGDIALILVYVKLDG